MIRITLPSVRYAFAFLGLPLRDAHTIICLVFQRKAFTTIVPIPVGMTRRDP